MSTPKLNRASPHFLAALGYCSSNKIIGSNEATAALIYALSLDMREIREGLQQSFRERRRQEEIEAIASGEVRL